VTKRFRNAQESGKLRRARCAANDPTKILPLK
jgi:hypothetical protein